ncbi:GNAT family N-acetyltransferase [Paenibacillus harenae]|uniref:Ribosomal protein S18 acetylase RimI-like enzyme n=1 Tax=Paenibacillus harenae TaxID=306543 RepID=A0ABT9TYE3_PAEHA|nr:GNAT family N-acetyltransferase [Paenibacillus harenae]MDQ0112338.1 ribosomal protein S18 acetylase RimI-like enzyme [Paenibacillus harenae]
MLIREATIDDAAAIAQVHVDSWRTAYNGIISADYLAKLDVGARAANWTRFFEQPDRNSIVYAAVNDDGSLVGFVSGGATRNPEYAYEAELYAIYLLSGYQGQGIGSRLVSEMANYFRRNGYRSFLLWVLEQNSAVGFYKRLGGQVFDRKELAIGEDKLVELAVGWESL